MLAQALPANAVAQHGVERGDHLAHLGRYRLPGATEAVVNRPPSPLTMLLSRRTRRREVIALVVGCAGTGLFMALAAAQPRRPKLAILLVAASETSSELSERRDALAELGWVDGRTIEIVARYADGDFDRVPGLIAELVTLKPDVLLTHTGVAARAAAAATGTIPVVIAAAGEEPLLELTGDLAHPVGNVTGLTLVSHEQHAKVAELLKQAYPSATRIGILANPLSPSYRDYPGLLNDALTHLGLDAIRAEAKDLGGLDDAFATIAGARANAVLVTADPNFNRPIMRRRIIELATAERLAVISTVDAFTREGGLLSLGTDYPAIYRRAAVYIDKILKGAKPSDLPIERPSVFRLMVNLKTARALGLAIPLSLLGRADEVIE